MVIDFHTHVFPDELAEKALSVLMKNIDNLYTPVNNATVSGLLMNMAKWNIDISVVQPVITKQSQMKKTNEWAAEISSNRIISFGGIYPHTIFYKQDIDFVAGLGLKGLKFHAEYQDFELDDKKMMAIYDYAFNKGLIILHHAGFDPGMPPPHKTCPEKFAKIVDTLKGGVMIAAHLGGHAQWDDVEKHLAGRNIYLDTSMGFEYYSKEQFLRIVKIHSAQKVLFASDAPWSSANNEIEILKKLPLSDYEKNCILYRNAENLLGINKRFE